MTIRSCWCETQAYFKADLPRLDRLVFRILPNPNTQVNAFLAGEVDMLQRVSAIDAQRLKGQPVTLVDTQVCCWRCELHHDAVVQPRAAADG